MTVNIVEAVNEVGVFFDRYGFNDRFEIETTENSITFTAQKAKKRVPHPDTKGFE